MGDVAYELTLTPDLSHVHNVFYVSAFKGDSVCEGTTKEPFRRRSNLGRQRQDEENVSTLVSYFGYVKFRD